MSKLFNRVLAEIEKHAEVAALVSKAQYEDDYDGFTHSNYAGLASEIIDELYEDGYNNHIPTSVIKNYVFEMF